MTNEELVKQIQQNIDTQNNLYCLYQQNTGMMFRIAKKFTGYAELEDLLQEAYIGLDTAARQYKPEKGEFSTYAYYHIYGAMSRYSKGNSSVTMSEHTRLLIVEYNRIMSEYEKYGKKPPSLETIAYLMGISEKTAKMVSETAHRVIAVSLDTPIGEDGDCCLSDTIQGSEGIEDFVVDKMQFEQMKHELWNQVDSLGDEPAHVLHERYQHGSTLEELARDFDMPVSRVQSIESDAFRKLKVRIRHTIIMEYANEYIRSRALRGTGLSNFNQTWTSSTEKVALELYGNGFY